MNHNAEAIIMIMRPPETTVQLVVNAVNGVGSIPGVGSMSPRLIPTELSGTVLCNFLMRACKTRSSCQFIYPERLRLGFHNIHTKPTTSRLRPKAAQTATVSRRRRFINHFKAQAAPSRPVVQHPPPAQTTSTYRT